MSHDIPYEPGTQCDICNKPGAFDFMGDFMCYECAFPGEEDTDEQSDPFEI